MTLTLQIVLAITGSVALLTGLFGGGVKAKEIIIPKLSILARLFSSLIGVALIWAAIWLQIPEQPVEQPTSTLISPTETRPTEVQIIPASAISSPISLTTTPIPKFGWVVYFEIGLKEGFWKPRMNSYQILSNCPDVELLGDIENRIEFSVDENAQLFPNNVIELHFWGISLPYGQEPQISSINPEQKTKIILGYTNVSFEQATQALNECQVKAIVNDKWTLQMSPIGPTPEK
jgi:hypothetical protein